MWPFQNNKQEVAELKRALAGASALLEFYQRYAGSQTHMSDFRTADEMREALTTNRYLVSELKRVVIQMMMDKGWSHETASQYIEREFSYNKACAYLKEANENQANNNSTDGS